MFFWSHELNLRIWRWHNVHQGTVGERLPLEVPLFVSSAVARISVKYCNARRKKEAMTFSRNGPERLGIEPKLDDSASTTLLGSTNTMFGDAVSLRHPRGGGGQPPLQRCCRENQIGRVGAIEAMYPVLRTSKMLHSRYGMVGGLS